MPRVGQEQEPPFNSTDCASQMLDLLLLLTFVLSCAAAAAGRWPAACLGKSLHVMYIVVLIGRTFADILPPTGRAGLPHDGLASPRCGTVYCAYM